MYPRLKILTVIEHEIEPQTSMQAELMTKQKKNVAKVPMVNIRKHIVHDWLLRYSCNKVMEMFLKYFFTSCLFAKRI